MKNSIKTWLCKQCGQDHPLAYLLAVNGAKHLTYRCPKSGQVMFIPFMAGLDIPTLPSKTEKRLALEETKKAQQPELALL